MEIFILPKFARQFRKLPKKIQEAAAEKEKIFRQNPFDAPLKTHKLRGELSEFWSFSITYSCRIIFEFADERIVRFYSIGDHDIYD